MQAGIFNILSTQAFLNKYQLSLNSLTKIAMQMYKCNEFCNLQNPTKCFLFSFNCKVICFVSHLSFSQLSFSILSFNIFSFVASLFLSLFTLRFRRLEVLKFLNSSNFSIFATCFSVICQGLLSSSGDIDSALSVSVSSTRRLLF